MPSRPLRAVTWLLRAAGAAALAADCPCCEQPMGWGRRGVCEPCWDEVLPLRGAACSRCGARLPVEAATAGSPDLCGACAGVRRHYAALAAFGSYQGRLRDLVRALKYRQRPGLAAPLGRMVAETLLRAAFARELEGIVIVPVPLASGRLAARGYNQARLIARSVAGHLARRGALGAPRVVEALRRTREGTPQTRLPRRERLRSQAGLYVGRRGAGRAIMERTVLLVDDVFTTGATATACSRELTGLGAREVYVAVAARTPSPREIVAARRVAAARDATKRRVE